MNVLHRLWLYLKPGDSTVVRASYDIRQQADRMRPRLEKVTEIANRKHDYRTRTGFFLGDAYLIRDRDKRGER